MSILTSWDMFFSHSEHCSTCGQHPQSVASFFYEPMCKVGRAIAESTGVFRGVPAKYVGKNFCVQDLLDYKWRLYDLD